MDDDWRIVPAKQIGNIVVRGPPVFCGYEGVSAEVNAQSFAPDGSGWFSTGDMGYMDTKGYIYITGKKEQKHLSRSLFSLLSSLSSLTRFPI